jgi:hypothetical protein
MLLADETAMRNGGVAVGIGGRDKAGASGSMGIGKQDTSLLIQAFLGIVFVESRIIIFHF